MPTSVNAIETEILAKLRCPHCQQSAFEMERAASTLLCRECSSAFPIKEGKFPDFLSNADRASLAKELDFWGEHFQATAYADESEESYQRWATMMSIQASDDVLEIGCGSGALLQKLSAKTKVGLEPAENLLFPSQGFSGVIGMADALPFKDQTFDLVYFKHSLHHIQDKWKAFAEAVRVTRNGGRVIVIEPNAAHPQRRLISNPESLLRKWHILTRFIGPVETFQRAGDLIKYAEKAGLTVEKIEFTQSSYTRLTPRQALQKLYAGVLRPFLPAELLMPNYFAEFLKSH